MAEPAGTTATVTIPPFVSRMPAGSPDTRVPVDVGDDHVSTCTVAALPASGPDVQRIPDGYRCTGGADTLGTALVVPLGFGLALDVEAPFAFEAPLAFVTVPLDLVLDDAADVVAVVADFGDFGDVVAVGKVVVVVVEVTALRSGRASTVGEMVRP